MATAARQPSGRGGTEGGAGEPGARRLVVAGVVAALLHAAVLLPAGFVLPDAAAGSEARRPVAVDFYSGPADLLPALTYQPAEPIPPGQVVDAPPVPDAEHVAPTDARFLGEVAQQVGRESRAHIRIAGPHRVGSTITGPGRTAPGQAAPGVFGPPGGAGGGSPAARGPVPVRAPPGATAGGFPGAAGAEDGAPAGARPAPARAEDPRTDGSGMLAWPRGDPLLPGVDQLAEAIAGSGIDRLDGVTEGDDTALSTRPFAFAGFFRRVRDRVAQFWDVRGAFALHDPLGSIYGFRDRETVALVTLDCAGSLLSTVLLEDSGARFLDQLAVDSIAQAAPFHNPPRELCDARRNHIVFTFGFYVEADQGPSLHIQLAR